jgi:D-alanyl-D-alanine carboxypeptidase
MSTSPFMTPSQSRERRSRAAQRRRRRRLGGAAAAVGVLLAVGLTLAFAKSSSASKHGHTDPHSKHGHGAGTPTVSQLGLPLGHPPLALSGIADPATDPVQIPFHDPPRAGILFNLDTGQVLWQRNAHVRVRIASLTKMMTALLAVQAEPPSTPVRITRLAVNQAGSKVGVLPLGKRVRLETLLYGLMLPSGNDAAYALAQKVAGTIPAFVTRMNEQAARLGMSCTRYSSPSGYYDEHNYSCAVDLAELARADISEPRIARVVRTYTAALPFPIKGGKLYLVNNNPLLIYHYPGATGMKTGWTVAAGRCLVATAERGGVRLGAIVLNSVEPGNQTRKLLDHGFIDVYHQAPVPEQPLPPGA